jgi:hypothetical protein
MVEEFSMSFKVIHGGKVRINTAISILCCKFFSISGHQIDKFRYVDMAPDSLNDLDPDAMNMGPKHWLQLTRKRHDPVFFGASKGCLILIKHHVRYQSTLCDFFKMNNCEESPRGML